MRRYRGGADQDPAAIGRTLGVSNIVTGSVRRGGNRVRVTAEMVRTATGDVAWSERYDRADADVLSLQDDLANAVATAVTGRLLPAERQAIAAQPTRSREAWDHFVRGNYFLAQRMSESHGRAVAEYERAARLDPAFTRAVARAAYAYAVASWRSEPVNGLAPDSSWRRARQAADRAIRADAGSSDGWMALGLVQMQRPESVAAARASLERAIALDSANAEAAHVYGWARYYQGGRAETVVAFHRALALEPGRAVTLVMLGWLEFIEHRWAEAERFVDSAVAVDRGFVQAYQVRGLIRYFRGDTAGARADFATRAAISGAWSLDTLMAAMIAVRAGDRSRLRALVDRDARAMSQPDSLDDGRVLTLATSLVLLDEREQGLDWLERTRWKNTNFYVNLLDPPFDRLRGNPRYERLLDEWRIPAGVGRSR